MKNSVLLVLTFSGLIVLSTNMFREYHYVNTPKTWAEAQNFCREVYTDLATVDSQDENIRLLLLLTAQDPEKHAWIGLYDDTKSWKWTMGDGQYDGEKGFFHWEANEPNNQDGKQSCVVMNWIGFWRDEICETDRPFVCFDEQGPSNYILVTKFMTWDDARNYCMSKYTDLVTVRNLTENNKIYPMLTRNVWIGLRRNLWTNWSDQSLTTFRNWYTNQPNNKGNITTSCAAVNTSTGTWYDDDCTTKQEFICEKLIPSRRRFKLRLQSETDLNDPAIQQQILEQLHDKMENDGLSDFKLRWIQDEGQTFHKEPKKKT